MRSPILDNLVKMLGAGRDNALLRYSLGNEYMKARDAAAAVTHLRAAIAHDAGYSAAWKLLGKALEETNAPAEALAAYRSGIEAAERKGDKQAAKEMAVFARRIERSS
jgi:predicted Zn-dependent protease